MSKEGKAKQALRSLLGIFYTASEEPEIIPILPDNMGDLRSKSMGKLVTELKPFIDSKKKLYDQYTELKKNHLVEGLLSKVTTDVLSKGMVKDSKFIEGVEYAPSEKVAEACQTVLETYRIEEHIKEIVYDTLVFGEYYLHIDHENKELDDRYEYPEIMPVYARSEVVEILRQTSNYESQTAAKTLDPKSVFFLSLNIPGQRIKLKLQDKSGSKYYIKVPTPFIMPSLIGLLNSITLMELLIPLSQLMKIDKGQLVTVGVPPGTPIKQMFAAAKDYEKELNNRFSSNMSEFSFDSVDSILQAFGKYKVIPSIGGQKGSMEVRDMPQPRDINIQDFEYLIATVANRLNVPMSYIFFAEKEDSRQRMAYLAKVQSIRNSIAMSVRRFLVDYMNHRKNEGERGYDIDPNQLIIKLPVVPGVDSIDTVDYMDALSGTMTNIQTLVEGFGAMLADMPRDLDKEKFIRVLNMKLEPVLGETIFVLSKEPPPEEGEGEGGLGSLGSY